MMKRVLSVAVCSLAVLVVAISVPYAQDGKDAKTITVIFRMDDYSSRSRTETETILIEAFKGRGLSLTVGVIPCVCSSDFESTQRQDCIPLTREKTDLLRKYIQSGTVDAALHGYSHQTLRSDMRGGFTEFTGLNYDVQLERIAKGGAFLRENLGARVATFIPPWNRYDLNTVKASENLGFTCFSAEVPGPAYPGCGVKFLPATCTIPGLREAVRAAGELPDPAPVILIYTHAASFDGLYGEKGDLVYEEFNGLLDWCLSRKDVRIMSIAQAMDIIPDLSAERFIEYGRFYRSISLLPQFLRPAGAKVYFAPGPGYSARVWKWRIITVLFYVLLFTASAVLGVGGALAIFQRARIIEKLFKYGGLLLLAAMVTYTFRDFELGIKGALAITVLGGICFGCWIYLIFRKKEGGI